MIFVVFFSNADTKLEITYHSMSAGIHWWHQHRFVYKNVRRKLNLRLWITAENRIPSAHRTPFLPSEKVSKHFVDKAQHRRSKYVAFYIGTQVYGAYESHLNSSYGLCKSVLLCIVKLIIQIREKRIKMYVVGKERKGDMSILSYSWCHVLSFIKHNGM